MLGRVDFLSFWGKARPEDGASAPFHPVAYHQLDVAAALEAILRARPQALQRGARMLGLDADEACSLLVALAALHDVGKFAPAFQAKVPELWPAQLGPFSASYAVRRPHTEDGYVIWEDLLADRVTDRLWSGGRVALDVLAPGVFGHHGRPVKAGFGRNPARQRFGDGGLAAALACADAALALLVPVSIAARPPSIRQARLASWWVAGLITVADWIGSNQRWFPYLAGDEHDPTLARYWDRARRLAETAVREAGLVPSRPASARSFAEIARVPGDPTPVQRWASKVPLPDGPVLVVIEDVTGSGKTEAAQMLVHRFMAAGRATGAYWAMPTMATANAMYDRQAHALGALYAPDTDGVRPSLVLAHGQQALHERFRATVLGEHSAKMSPDPGDDDEPESAAACAAFLADDSRAALLADVGAGTVDQALLAALPSRYNTVRLFGLADKVLVVDEAHAFDAYMAVEVHELLRFQAALGGSAVVLSATLSRKQREAIVQAWRDGLGGGGRRSVFATADDDIRLTSSSYPLATLVSSGRDVREEELAAASWSYRTVPVDLVHTVDAALARVVSASAAGGAVAWIRNTVDDCLAAAALLRERGLEPVVFHARFAQGDRQTREHEVMNLFGKKALDAHRRGRVLVATQVVEQSLDLDFDAMVSDVAPVDLLIQRVGRLWRHADRTASGRRPAGLECRLVVLAPEPLAEPPEDWLGPPFAGTAKVYGDAGILWRTVRVLADRAQIRTPENLRDLIEAVYGSDDVPAPLMAAAQRAEGEQGAHAAAATYAVLKPPDGYHAEAVAWVNDLRAPTRLGEVRTPVRLARARADGVLEPWVRVEGPPWKSWALSEVSVRARQVPAGSLPDACWADAVARVQAGWGRFERDIPVLPLVEIADGRWEGQLTPPGGQPRRFIYTLRDGLARLPVTPS